MDTKREMAGTTPGADQRVGATLEYGERSSPADGSWPADSERGEERPSADAPADYAAVQVADYVRDAARKIDRLADDLRHRNVSDLLSAATEYGRKHPVMMMAGAAVLGFALSRLIKAGVADPTTHGKQGDRSDYVDDANVDLTTGVEPMRDLA
jgi:hypothetical protein